MSKVNENQISSVMSEMARRRWAKATDEQRQAQGEMLAEARQKKVKPEKRREIARIAAAASARVRSAKAKKKK